ncbi:MAG: hypothetical protein NXI22_19350 [bacterium]|nr:hypothetical protein [bacterium]
MTTSKPVKHLTIKTIGKERYSTKPNSMELFGGIFFGLLLFPCGCALFGYWAYQLWLILHREVVNGNDYIPIVVALVIGLLMLAASIYLFFNVRSILAYQVTVCADGFYVKERGKLTVFAWEDVVLVEELIMLVTVKVSRWQPKSMAHQRTQRGYTVHRVDGEKFELDGTRIEHTSPIVGAIGAAQKKYKFAWKSERGEMTV